MRFGLATFSAISAFASRAFALTSLDDSDESSNHNRDEISIVNVNVNTPASSVSYLRSKKEQGVAHSPFDNSKTNKKIVDLLGSRRLQKYILGKDDYNNHNNDEDKDKAVIQAVMVDDTSIPPSKQFEFCKNLGVMKSCSSKEDECVALTEHQLSLLPDAIIMEYTADEKRELNLCLDPPSIEALHLLTRDGDNASTATAIKEKGVHRVTSTSEENKVLNTTIDDGRSLRIMEEVKYIRQLRSDNDCESYCSEFGRPKIKVSEYAFSELIRYCTGDDTSSCLAEYNTPLDCWNTSQVTDMQKAFKFRQRFNEPLGCWDVSSVTNMRGMFKNTYAFNQPIESWGVSSVTDMGKMFYYANSFNQPIESWEVSKVENMHTMFYNAPQFNQCLSKWADKTGVVETGYMLDGTGCPSESDPDPNVGPWCLKCKDKTPYNAKFATLFRSSSQ